jgi:hypothetical protein
MQALSGGSAALSCFDAGACNISQSQFDENVASGGGGGAIVWTSAPPNIISQQEANSAVYGPFVASGMPSSLCLME